MKGIVAWFAGNHVAANLLMLFVLLAGTVIGLTMKLEVFPETVLPQGLYRGDLVPEGRGAFVVEGL